jgi:hypothetical protein
MQGSALRICASPPNIAGLGNTYPNQTALLSIPSVGYITHPCSPSLCLGGKDAEGKDLPKYAECLAARFPRPLALR